DTGEIVASELTTEHVGDETALPGLLSKADADVARFLADGAYDGQGVYDCLAAKYGADIALIVPPPKNAVLGGNPQRDKHIGYIGEHGRMKWQTDIGYTQRSLIEAQIGRWKEVIGESLQARDFDNQVCEISIGTKVLNRMTELGRAKYERVV
ncbi:transposase, partial [Sedimentitalea sp.]